jgi:hypothetical protein
MSWAWWGSAKQHQEQPQLGSVHCIRASPSQVTKGTVLAGKIITPAAATFTCVVAVVAGNLYGYA